ncbi:MAG: hypothetical protein WC381_08800 [Kiritimatiellia bacterium]|jgi:hypothetical protein
MKHTRVIAWMAGAAIMMLATGSLAEDSCATPAAAPVGRQAIFQKTDTNGDGNVSSDEFQAGQNVWFKEMDANGDGKLTADEFAKDHQGWFNEMDASHDGVVVMEEYIVFFCGSNAKADKDSKPAGTGKPTLFETTDANDDGFVTVPECVVYRIAIFRQLDANGDGKLTPEEYAAGANKRFTAMDLNKDNAIAKDEFDATMVNKSRGSRAPETNLPVMN